jgi:hypothetical protein
MSENWTGESAEKSFLVSMDSIEIEDYEGATMLAQVPVEYIRAQINKYGLKDAEDMDEVLDLMDDIYEDLELDLDVIREHGILANCDEDVLFLIEDDLESYESWRVVLRMFTDAGLPYEILLRFVQNYNNDGSKSSALWVRAVTGILNDEFHKINKIKELDLEKTYTEAQDFMKDPVVHLNKLRAELDVADVVGEVVVKIKDYIDCFFGTKIETDNPLLRVLLTYSPKTTESSTALFTLLKQANFTKSEIITFLSVSEEGLSSEEKMSIKGMRVILDIIYDEDE